jgi:hypothetical protein
MVNFRRIPMSVHKFARFAKTPASQNQPHVAWRNPNPRKARGHKARGDLRGWWTACTMLESHRLKGHSDDD